MEEIIKIIHVTRKGRMLNTLESFHIYKETKAENRINDKLTAKRNEIFEAVLKTTHKSDTQHHYNRTPP